MLDFNTREVDRNDFTRASLLLRIRDNGPERELAWKEFFAIYSPIIRAFSLRRGAPADMADDVVQEVVRRFFQASPKFVYDPHTGRFRGYLKTCASRVLCELRNARKNETSLIVDVEEPESGGAVWEEEWQKRQFSLALERVRKQYSRRRDSEKTFRAFEQCSIFQRPVSEVALELAISIDSVHAANSRVIKALRAAIEQLADILD